MEYPNDAAGTTHLSKKMNSSSADLVTGKKLLTREEECTLKTALAFVVIKARARANSKANKASENLAGIVKKSTKYKGDSDFHYYREHNDTSPSSKVCDSSILDHLVCQKNKSRLPATERRSLECKGDRKHMEYMFRAAKTLAETWLITHQQLRPKGATETTVLALQGAIGHLAHQLHLLLVEGANRLLHEEGTTSSSNNDSSLPNNVEHKSRRYRRHSLSSKSAADSTLTPSSASRTTSTKGGVGVLVTPSTNQSQSQSVHSIRYKNKQNHGMVEAFILVQEWIRATLLGEDYQHQKAAAVNDTVKVKDSRTILSCQNISVLDIQSSFQVYNVMIPQIARMSPPLIGHIFQVVARLVKDLYSDRVVLVGGNGQLLDHLATSALSLLELCWTTEITVGGSVDRESHRSFLLLSLQEILGHLLVPLTRQDLAAEHYRLTLSEAYLRLNFQQKESSGGLSSLEPQNFRVFKRRRVLQKEHQQPHRERISDLLPKKSSFSLPREGDASAEKVRKHFQAPRTLDPEAKLLLRMAVYRLIAMGRKRGEVSAP